MTCAQLAVILNGLLGRTLSSLDDLQLGMPIFDFKLYAQAFFFLFFLEASVAHATADAVEHERWAGLG